MVQLASETLVLREQLMRNKLDSRTVGSALLATQEELRAAFNREQACEEGYNALLADLDSCRVNQERIGVPLPPSLGLSILRRCPGYCFRDVLWWCGGKGPLQSTQCACHEPGRDGMLFLVFKDVYALSAGCCYSKAM